MSRIGNTPINVPDKTTVQIKDGLVEVKGEKGQQSIQIPIEFKVEEKDGVMTVSRPNDEKINKALHGTYRALLSNVVIGVSEGWNKVLEINGSGYKAAVEGNEVTLQVGFSHPVKLTIPDGLEIKIVKNKITITGIDKQLVGEFAAKIREVRKPEPYKGKGIKYKDEHIVRKVGKALKASE